MSRLGSQIDGLRTAAQTERTLGHHKLEQVLLDAADTITELRDDLQRANAATQDAEHDESMAWDRVRKAEAENAKLKQELEAVGTAAYQYGRNDLAAENAKLRELFNETLIRLVAANEAAGGGFTDARYCELLESHGIEVDG